MNPTLFPANTNFYCMLFFSAMRSMSPEDELLSLPLGYSSTREDVSLSCGDLESSLEPGRRSRTRSSLLTRTPEADMSW